MCPIDFYENSQSRQDIAASLSALSGSNAMIALIPVGELPYYSNVETLDMIGLVDDDPSRSEFDLVKDMPGHLKTIDVAYMHRRSVNLVFGDPSLTLIKPVAYNSIWLHSIMIRFWHLDKDPTEFSVVEIPLRSGSVARALYLVRHPKIDELIDNGAWQEKPIRAGLFNPFEKHDLSITEHIPDTETP